MGSTKVEPEVVRSVEAPEAARLAASYLRSLFPELSKYSLEEVELSEDGKYWLITLGIEVPKTKVAPQFGDLLFGPPTTKYKVFKVDVRTGKVLAMKIRSLG